MKRILMVIALSLVVGLAAGAPRVEAFGAGAGTVRDVEHEKVIRKLFVNFVDLWNKHDTATMSDMWTLDGDHVEPDGQMAKSRLDVAELLKKQHGTVFAGTTLDLAVDSVWFMPGDAALVDATYGIVGIIAPNGTEIPKRTGHLTALLIREKGEWLIAASRLMIPAKLPYKPK